MTFIYAKRQDLEALRERLKADHSRRFSPFWLVERERIRFKSITASFYVCGNCKMSFNGVSVRIYKEHGDLRFHEHCPQCNWPREVDGTLIAPMGYLPWSALAKEIGFHKIYQVGSNTTYLDPEYA